LSPGPPMRVCPVCRTPNAETSPSCVRCNYAFFTTREAIVGPVDESMIPPDPEGRPIPRAQPMAPPAYAPPPYAPPPPRPRPSAPAPFEPAPETFEPVSPEPPPKKGAKPKRRAKTGGFLRIPEGLDDKGLEALRYTAMRQGVMVLIVLLGVSLGVNALLGFLRIRVPGIGIASEYACEPGRTGFRPAWRVAGKAPLC